MIQHHTGALTMVNDLFESEGAGQDGDIFKFASMLAQIRRLKLAAWSSCSLRWLHRGSNRAKTSPSACPANSIGLRPWKLNSRLAHAVPRPHRQCQCGQALTLAAGLLSVAGCAKSSSTEAGATPSPA